MPGVNSLARNARSVITINCNPTYLPTYPGTYLSPPFPPIRIRTYLPMIVPFLNRGRERNGIGCESASKARWQLAVYAIHLSTFPIAKSQKQS